MINLEKVAEINLNDVEDEIYKMNAFDREIALTYYKELESSGNLKELAKSEFFPRWFFETMSCH